MGGPKSFFRPMQSHLLSFLENRSHHLLLVAGFEREDSGTTIHQGVVNRNLMVTPFLNSKRVEQRISGGVRVGMRENL